MKLLAKGAWMLILVSVLFLILATIPLGLMSVFLKVLRFSSNTYNIPANHMVVNLAVSIAGVLGLVVIFIEQKKKWAENFGRTIANALVPNGRPKMKHGGSANQPIKHQSGQ
jgi:hypothetical protein